MQVELLTPEKKIFSGEAKGIQLPGIDGSFEVLRNHAPLIAALRRGIVRILLNGSEKQVNIRGGFVEVLNNNVVVLAEGADE